jgi:hypothetical protein
MFLASCRSFSARAAFGPSVNKIFVLAIVWSISAVMPLKIKIKSV